MPSQKPRQPRPKYDVAYSSIAIRVGSRRSPRRFHEVLTVGARDAGRFARLVDDQVHAYPNDPLVIAINGYQPWLREVLHSCIEDHWADISDLAREVHFASTMQFPQRASRRGQWVPWTFLIDHVNVPQVYYWSVDIEPPRWDDAGEPNLDRSRVRTGVWTCGKGACRFDRQASVTIIFTRPNAVTEHIVTELMFDYLYKDNDFDQPRQDAEGICWTFSRLYYLLTDWQNVIGEVVARLDEAEVNSEGQHLPVKTRTRQMHREVDRLFEMKEYLRFHSRAFKKLQKLKPNVSADEQKDPLWTELDDAVEDLEQFSTSLDSLQERFNNLTDLEFNITNATQAENAQFLSVIAALFLPVSYLAAIFSLNNLTWKPIWYLYAAIPLFIVSATFTAVFPWAKKRVQASMYPVHERRLRLLPNQFTMLGDELPDSVNVANSARLGRPRHKALRPSRTSSLVREKSSGRSEYV